MKQRYVRPTVGGWLRPTLIGPWVTVYTAITAGVLLGIDRGVVGKVLGWTVLMAVGSVWTFVFCLMLLAIDLALLGIKIRTLPSGKRGWLTTMLSPLAVFGIYTMFPPHSFYRSGPWAIVAAILVPMAIVAATVRVIGGTAPPR